MDEFHVRLKLLRKERRLTQAQLAKHLEVCASVISAYEKGSLHPVPDKLRRIACFFGVSTDYLLGLSDNKNFKSALLTPEQNQSIIQIIRQYEEMNIRIKRTHDEGRQLQ